MEKIERFLISLIALILIAIGNIECNEEESIRRCAETQDGRVRLMLDELTSLNEWKDQMNNVGSEDFVFSKSCLARQYVASRNLFDINKNKWNMQAIVENFGDDAYNYCRYELERNHLHGCTFALQGVRCLLKANRNVCATRINLINCIYELGASNEQLVQYSEFPEKEKIPCLFKCFADKMQLYQNNYDWNLKNWVNAFGPMKYDNQNFSDCKTSAERVKNDNECDWMYEEHMCLERLNYNTHGTECNCLHHASTTPRSIDTQRSIKTAFFTRF